MFLSIGLHFPVSPHIQCFFFIILIIYFMYAFLTVLDLRCCVGFSLAAESRGHSLVVVLGLLTAVASLAVEQGL